MHETSTSLSILSKAVFKTQCFCWPPKSSGHFPNFTIIMITFSDTFQYKIVLQVFQISGNLLTKSQTMAYGLEGTRTLKTILKHKFANHYTSKYAWVSYIVLLININKDISNKLNLKKKIAKILFPCGLPQVYNMFNILVSQQMATSDTVGPWMFMQHQHLELLALTHKLLWTWLFTFLVPFI